MMSLRRRMLELRLMGMRLRPPALPAEAVDATVRWECADLRGMYFKIGKWLRFHFSPYISLFLLPAMELVRFPAAVLTDMASDSSSDVKSSSYS